MENKLAGVSMAGGFFLSKLPSSSACRNDKAVEAAPAAGETTLKRGEALYSVTPKGH
jgi:hypothetical protein